MHQKSAFTSHRDGAATDGQLPCQKISLPMQRQCCPDDLHWCSGLEGRYRLFAQVRSDVGIYLSLRASHQQMHACGTASLVLRNDFLDGASKGGFARRVIGETKTLSSDGFGPRLGAKWNRRYREQQADQ